MPSDPIVNDHFADILWVSGEKLQQILLEICIEFRRS